MEKNERFWVFYELEDIGVCLIVYKSSLIYRDKGKMWGGGGREVF